MRPFFGSISGSACLFGLAAVLALPVQIQAEGFNPIQLQCSPDYLLSGSSGTDIGLCGTPSTPVETTCEVEDCGQLRLLPAPFTDILFLNIEGPASTVYLPLGVNVGHQPVHFSNLGDARPNSFGFLQLFGETPTIAAARDPKVTVSMLIDVSDGELVNSNFEIVSDPQKNFSDAIELVFDVTPKHPHEHPTVIVAVQILVDGVPVFFKPSKHGGDGDPD